MVKGGYRVYKRVISSSGSGGVGVRVFEWGVFCVFKVLVPSVC